MEPLLICTDLDRTLIPNGVQPESHDARRCFSALVSQPEIKLAYVSGRHRDLVYQAIAIYNLPLPDYIIGDVGTTLYHVVSAAQWDLCKGWKDEIGQDWHGKSHEMLRSLFVDLRDLRLQEPSKQNDYKLSYYVPLHADHGKLMGQMQERLDQNGVQANMILSVDEPAGVGLLDLLPVRASKLHAVEFLLNMIGMYHQKAVFCGDSGNDLEVLISRVPAVLVANGSQEVKAQASRLANESGNSDLLYQAEGGTFGMNGNYAAGILEGVAHYHPELRQLIEETAL